MAALPTDQETHQNFATLPPFPSNIPTAPLLKISLSNLLQKNASEEQKLYSACRDLGFFYLDLQSPPSTAPPDTGSAGPGSALLSTSSQLFTLGQEIFALPLEEKLQYDLSSQNSYFGYKGYGAGVIDSNGTRDRVEFWNISKDDILHHSSSPLPHPSILRAAETRATIAKFMTSSHEIVTVILGILNANLGLPQGTLESLHRLEAESGDQVRWVKSPPQPRNDRAVALGEHTDFGSVTVLFNRLGGLQVLISSESSQGGGWKYVRPLQGCCVVNLGDALVKFTRGVLRSNVRVFSPLPFLGSFSRKLT